MTLRDNQPLHAGGNQAYLFPFTMPDGKNGYVYLMSPVLHERELTLSIRAGTIPDYATVIACGRGEPNERLRYNMERYYGVIHEQLEAA